MASTGLIQGMIYNYYRNFGIFRIIRFNFRKKEESNFRKKARVRTLEIRKTNGKKLQKSRFCLLESILRARTHAH